MAEETKKAAPAPEAEGKKPGKKDSWPTNCVFSNKRIRRKDWYFRDGKYFANKKNFKQFVAQEAEKAKKAAEASSAQAAPQA